MYGLFAYIYYTNQLNVGKYTIHWASGISNFFKSDCKKTKMYEEFTQVYWIKYWISYVQGN